MAASAPLARLPKGKTVVPVKNAAPIKRGAPALRPKQSGTNAVDEILATVSDIRKLRPKNDEAQSRDVVASRIGTAIRLLRIHWIMQQKELAVAVGITQSQLSNYELGKNLPDIHVVCQLARALKVSVADFLRLADVR